MTERQFTFEFLPSILGAMRSTMMLIDVGSTISAHDGIAVNLREKIGQLEKFLELKGVITK